MNQQMRLILVDWLIEVCYKFKFQKQTIFITVSYIDRFLQKQNVLRKNLQLIGVTALFLASKFQEIYPPNIKDFIYITDNSKMLSIIF
ncbi:MAG: hypothetical protein ACK559_35900 [bacterium]